MKIEVTFDVSAYEREANIFVEQAIAPAIVDVLNVADIHGSGRKCLVEHLASVLFPMWTSF